MILNPETKDETYPEINVQVPCATKLPVASLESNSHLVITMQLLVEALDAVGRQHNVVRADELEGHRRRNEQPSRRRGQMHFF